MIKHIWGFTYDCSNCKILADFYIKLLGFENVLTGGGWTTLRSPQGWLLSFQEIDDYVPPVWPWKKGKQQQMIHMDIFVENLDESVEFAIKCGAKKSDIQYHEDSSIVMLDPEGHPFCLTTYQL